MFEDLPVLLKFKFDKDALILRFDDKGLRNFDDHKNAISEVILEQVEISELDLANELKELIGDVFEYKIYPKNSKQIFEFWGDYGRFCSTIVFKAHREIFSKYTKADLSQKGEIISELYSDLFDRFNKNSAIYTKTTEKLRIEIQDDIVRFQRKADFFEDKANAFQQSVKSLEKMLKILENPDN